MTQFFFVMKFLLVIALVFSFNANQFSTNMSKDDIGIENSQELLESKENLGTVSIVMEDMIARVNSGDTTDPITSFKVYDNDLNHQLRFESYSCNASRCEYDLSQLPPDTYEARATAASGNFKYTEITIQ